MHSKSYFEENMYIINLLLIVMNVYIFSVCL